MVHIKIKSFKGKKLQPLNNFFNKVFRDVIKIDTQYNKFTSDHTFAYKERQLNTSLLPALQMNANAILHEQPIKRKRKETEGRIDFWICKKNYDIFLEVKHGYQNKKLINKNIKDKWKEITNQLNKIKKRSVNERKTLEHNLVYTIGLLFLVHTQESEKYVKHSKTDCTKIMKETLGDISKKPLDMWSMGYILPEDQRTFEYDVGTEYTSHVQMIAFIHKIFKD